VELISGFIVWFKVVVIEQYGSCGNPKMCQ